MTTTAFDKLIFRTILWFEKLHLTRQIEEIKSPDLSEKGGKKMRGFLRNTEAAQEF